MQNLLLCISPLHPLLPVARLHAPPPFLKHFQDTHRSDWSPHLSRPAYCSRCYFGAALLRPLSCLPCPLHATHSILPLLLPPTAPYSCYYPPLFPNSIPDSILSTRSDKSTNSLTSMMTTGRASRSQLLVYSS